ncbi:MAG: GGDEF domain-containing protein [Deferrisomatales bacterium]|nr:GGDEF domain-containing protein [Deferrisomatales bacterium]
MPAPLRTLLYPLLLPGGALFLATALLLHGGGARHWLAHPLASLALPLVAGSGALLAWRFHRSRLVLGLVLVCAAELILRRVTGTSAAAYTHAGVAVLLPLNLALMNLLPERGLITLRGLGRLGLLAAQPAAAVWWYLRDPALALRGLEHRWVDLPALGPGDLPQAAAAAFAAAAAVLALRCLRRPSALDAGFLWALVACLAGLLHPSATIRSVYFSGAAVILVAGLVEAFHFLAFRDELTGLPARRALNEALARTGGPYTLAMVDVDHFKKVNDRHGHDVGDQVLKMLATRLAAVSGGGRAYRYGGEEFTVLFPRKSLQEALPHLQRVREQIAAEPFRLRRFLRPLRKPNRPRKGVAAVHSLRVTVSIGAAEKGARHPSAEAVLQAADKALYKAKRGGRNQVRG